MFKLNMTADLASPRPLVHVLPTLPAVGGRVTRGVRSAVYFDRLWAHYGTEN